MKIMFGPGRSFYVAHARLSTLVNLTEKEFRQLDRGLRKLQPLQHEIGMYLFKNTRRNRKLVRKAWCGQ